MKVGDVVRSKLLDEIGIVVAESRKVSYNSGKSRETKEPHSFRVLWSGARCAEWTGLTFVEVISSAR